MVNGKMLLLSQNVNDVDLYKRPYPGGTIRDPDASIKFIDKKGWTCGSIIFLKHKVSLQSGVGMGGCSGPYGHGVAKFNVEIYN